MDFPPPTESDSARRSLSTRILPVSPGHDSVFAPVLSPRSLLRVSPHICPRPMVEPSPGLRSLLMNAQLSHYNYLAGTYHSPRKRDFFHERTLIYTFTPSFKARYFAYSRYELPRNSDPPPVSTPQTEPTTRPLTQLPPQKPIHKHLSMSKSKSEPQTVSRPAFNRFTLRNARFTRFTGTTKPRSRPVVCIEDGQNLGRSSVRTYAIDLLDYFQRYIGFAPGATSGAKVNNVVSLKAQAMLELLEKTSEALRSAQPYKAVFLVDGTRIRDLAAIPFATKVLVFSTNEYFTGIYEETSSQ